MERLFTISHADLLSTPSPNYWRNPRPTIGKTLAQLLEKPSPNYWKNPTIGNSNSWKCPKIFVGLGNALVQQMSLLIFELKKNTEKTTISYYEKEITIIWTITLMKLTWSVNNQSIDPIMWSDYWPLKSQVYGKFIWSA